MGKTTTSLLAIGTEGPWNVPLLRNAAELSGTSLRFVGPGEDVAPLVDGDPADECEAVLRRHDVVIACETAPRSRDLYELPSPRGRVALLVGNEMTGLARPVLRSADHVVSIPMRGRGMSSINVAAAAAVALYSLDRDLGRKGVRAARKPVPCDLLVRAPEDPSETGSTLRSAWAFGWRAAYLSDPHGSWFSPDRSIVDAGRHAARRKVNPIVVLPEDRIDWRRYDVVLRVGPGREGEPLSRFTPPRVERMLLVLDSGGHTSLPHEADEAHVDFRNGRIAPCFRHQASVALSLVSRVTGGNGRR